MEKTIPKPIFRKRKARTKGRRVSIYFDKVDVYLYEYVEELAKEFGTTPAHVIAEMLKSLGLMSLYSRYWVNQLKFSR